MRLAGLILMLLLAAGPPEAQALSLGRLQGTAQIGRPLALTVQIQTDPGEDLSALCLEAEVYHAETRQDPRGVRVQADAAQPATVRISSANGVDEPVVTLLLRAGCAQKPPGVMCCWPTRPLTRSRRPSWQRRPLRLLCRLRHPPQIRAAARPSRCRPPLPRCPTPRH